MAEQTLEYLLQSVGRSLSEANRALGRPEGGAQYAVSELQVSAPLSRLTVNEEVLVDTDVEDEDDPPANRYVQFTVVPLPRDEEPEQVDELPDLEEESVVAGVERVLAQGFSEDQIRLSFDPDADAPAGTITGYRLRGREGPDRPEVTLTVAGRPPEEGTLGAIDEPTAVPGRGGDRTYRRREDSDTWHFCRNCSNDPGDGAVTAEERPSSGELCDECQAKAARDACE